MKSDLILYSDWREICRAIRKQLTPLGLSLKARTRRIDGQITVEITGVDELKYEIDNLRKSAKLARMSKKSNETVYRSPDGQRWRLSSSPKYDNKTMAIRLRDGRVWWDTNLLNELVEESVWLKRKK